MVKKLIDIDNSKSEAKYRQIVNSVIKIIRKGLLNKGDKLPSVNDIARAHGLSRDTVLMAYNKLKARGIVQSVPGKGYYVDSTNVEREERILLLFDEFNSFKEDLYNSFTEMLEGKASIDIFFHHFNPEVFSSLVLERKELYTSYVIMPANLPNIQQVLNKLPQDRIYLLDRNPEYLNNRYPVVYQDFDEDMYQGLKNGFEYLTKYRRLVLVFPGGKEPEGFYTGFRRFCEDFNFANNVVPVFMDYPVKRGDVYILPNDRDLDRLVRNLNEQKLNIGADVGIISLNDTGLKEIAAGGITTLSTDFFEMGKNLARIILNKNKKIIKNPSRLIVRNSL
jgi:DNA-binding transcriptional regulator YhcF (GntR family)